MTPALASAPDFFAKLERLERDGLPQFKDSFRRLLHEQSDQNLMRLSSQLRSEKQMIKARLERVNASLKTAAYNPGTYLEIETEDRALSAVGEFESLLRASLSHSLSKDDAQAETRFGRLKELVDKLSDADPKERRWRELALDVRLHVEFNARELDGAGVELEVYRGGAGKSGGQRQKLTLTCLAAALRYQLSGEDGEFPRYSTVVVDEAFDKADPEFTTMTMQIFKTFGFQMIVATPLKAVMTLDPFIGGACFVHSPDRQTSRKLLIEYDHTEKRLILSDEIRQADADADTENA